MQILGTGRTQSLLLTQVFAAIQTRQIAIDSSGDVWSLSQVADGLASGVPMQRWDGSSWATVGSPFGSGNPVSLSAAASGDLWVMGGTAAGLSSAGYGVGSATSVAWWNGASWTAIGLPPQFAQVVAGSSHGVAFAIDAPCGLCQAQGAATPPATQPARWDGGQWVDLPITAYVAAGISVRDDLAWFAGTSTDGAGTVLVSRWDGASATTSFSRPANAQTLSVSGIWSSGDDAVWITGYPTLRYDGASWQEMDVTTNGVWGTGPDDVWLIEAPGTIDHWDGASLSMAKQTDIALTSISGSASDVWVSGARGATLRLSAATDAGSQ